MLKKIVLGLLCILIFSVVSAFETDSLGIVTYVVDGDTIDVLATSGFMKGSEYRIRFADINAPELDTEEGYVAKEALKSLLYGKVVYIDVDNLTTYDPYGNVVAVIYLPINETHAMNVNYYMVLNNYATIWDFTNNEFNPYSWVLYETYKSERESKDVKIIMVELNPPGRDKGNEWAVIKNFGSEDVNLEGWTIETTHGRTVKIPLSGTLHPNETLIIKYNKQWLDNSDEKLILRDNLGRIVDETITLNDRLNNDLVWYRKNGQWVFGKAG